MAVWHRLTAAVAAARSLNRPGLSDAIRSPETGGQPAGSQPAAARPSESGGQVTGIIEDLNEIVRHLRDEIRRLTREVNRANAVLANMADGIIIVDHRLRIERLNPAAARLLGVAPPAGVGSPLAAVAPSAEVQQTLVTALQQGAPVTSVVRLDPQAIPAATAAGEAETRDVRVTGIPVVNGSDSDGPAGLLVLQDVTELRRAEVIRREFVGNVSHELRTPLASLKALVETLEEGALDDPPAAREFLSQMHVEVDSLAQLVQELLELTRIESGQVVLRLQSVAPAAIVEAAARRLRMQAERAGIDLALEVPPDLPAVTADPDRVGQVMINLLHNAIKFTSAGGKVTLGAAAGTDGVRFSVTDTGIGVRAADLPRLFERFYKVDRSRATGGTGLGLAIAKHLIQAHGGRIWAESAGEGQGTTFWFTLPRAESAAPPPKDK